MTNAMPDRPFGRRLLRVTFAIRCFHGDTVLDH